MYYTLVTLLRGGSQISQLEFKVVPQFLATRNPGTILELVAEIRLFLVIEIMILRPRK